MDYDYSEHISLIQTSIHVNEATFLLIRAKIYFQSKKKLNRARLFQSNKISYQSRTGLLQSTPRLSFLGRPDKCCFYVCHQPLGSLAFAFGMAERTNLLWNSIWSFCVGICQCQTTSARRNQLFASLNNILRGLSLATILEGFESTVQWRKKQDFASHSTKVANH